MGAYKIYNMQGKLMGTVNATSPQEARDAFRLKHKEKAFYIIR